MIRIASTALATMTNGQDQSCFQVLELDNYATVCYKNHIHIC